jgi:competence protein ComEA
MNHEPFSKSTYRGLLLLAMVLIVVFLLPDIVVYLSPSKKMAISYFDRATERKIRKLQSYESRHFSNERKWSRYTAPPEKFDPNDYSIEDWMRLGLSEKQAAVILKFTKYRLKSNDDLKRIFVINDELFDLIKDSTFYSSTASNTAETIANPKKPVANITVELNGATIETLQQVRGIGPFFAKQIIKQRDALGGYYSFDQLLEVWKVDDEKLAAWTPYLTIDPSKIKQLNINSASAEELKSHPYISWNLANSIVKLRLQNGPYKKIEDTQKSVLMTPEVFSQLKRYLTL